ncbi:MAG: hypothetical protein NPIRA04_29070 [Nitrospirales bacterium]|nr:MAG: hypothetical protein NPIRA04_29070 [Nitrospirales bacterium]
MDKSDRGKLLKDLESIHKEGVDFFRKASQSFEGKSFLPYPRGKIERNEFWNKLDDILQKKAQTIVTEIIKVAPLISESARLTTFLSQTDQIDFGHAIKGLRSSLHLCRYRYWGPEVLHDEGTVLGVEPAGQTDDDGVYPDTALQIFEDCHRRIASIVELVNPLTVQIAEKNIITTGQKSTAIQTDIAFIMMWMEPDRPDLEDAYLTVKRTFEQFGISAERADDIEHSGKITEEIINKIRSSEFLYADLTGARPNVYYEVGFAHALSKKVILYRKSSEPLHFDLAGYNCPEYKNFSDLEKKLNKRLESMTGRKIKEKK